MRKRTEWITSLHYHTVCGNVLLHTATTTTAIAEEGFSTVDTNFSFCLFCICCFYPRSLALPDVCGYMYDPTRLPLGSAYTNEHHHRWASEWMRWTKNVWAMWYFMSPKMCFCSSTSSHTQGLGLLQVALADRTVEARVDPKSHNKPFQRSYNITFYFIFIESSHTFRNNAVGKPLFQHIQLVWLHCWWHRYYRQNVLKGRHICTPEHPTKVWSSKGWVKDKPIEDKVG